MLTKSIVVHLADDPRSLDRLKLAVAIAQRFGAHLNVVYATAEIHQPAASIGRAASLEYMAEATEMATHTAEALEGHAKELCKALKSWEWHLERGEVEAIVARFAHLADLVIVEQSPHSFFEDSVVFHMSDHLVMSAGCPMLLMPETWRGGDVGRRVLIAWKNGREAIGAVRGALSFLEQADEVMILAYAWDKYANPPGSDLVTYLAHHGIASTVVGLNEKGGEEILKVAKDKACDCLVMGAYAHSRLRELFVGGATDYIMRHTTIPVLMRH